MKSLFCGVSLIGVLAVTCLIGRTTGADDQGAATIDKIMETLHQGRKSTLATLKTALKSSSPDWAAIQKQTKTYAKLAGDLPKNDPPKGDPAHFKKLAKAFAANAKALDEAAQKEDLAATKTALGKITRSCDTCHDAHKEE